MALSELLTVVGLVQLPCRQAIGDRIGVDGRRSVTFLC